MKIYIEGTPLFRWRSGVGQYTKRLLDATIAISPNIEYSLFGFLFFGKQKPTPLGKPKNLRYRFVRYLPGRIYSRLHKAHIAPPIDLLLGAKPNIFFFPNFVSWPLALNEKTVIVVYDLSYITHKQFSDEKNRLYLTEFVPKSIARASHVVTISENAKKEVMEYYKIADSDISIINPAVDHSDYYVRSSDEIQSIKDQYKIDGEYILYTGTIEPRKNIVGILKAYAELSEALQNRFTLVLAGGKGWMDDEIHQLISELSGLKIILTGYVPDEDLPPLYSGASVFVYPSFYEGFGMPPLEAMACGVPVITSNNSSLPEVVGDAGIMIDADDQKGLTAAIEKVLTDKKLAESMRKRGLAQAQKFTWEKSAQKLLEVFNKVGSA